MNQSGNDSPASQSDAAQTHTLGEDRVQLTQLQQEMNGLLYAISHDLRAPLRAISGFGQALREHDQTKLDATGLHYLQRIEHAAQRMSILLDALVAISRLSQVEMTYTEFNLGQVATEAAATVALRYPQHHPQLVVAPNLMVRGDARLLRDALQRLLDNAWKCTAGRVNARIEIGQAMAEQRPCYYVRDNGVGFDMNYAAKLFVPFQHLHAHHALNGIGIGLACVQRIVARHGGRVWAEAKPDGGAQFFFTLPTIA